MSDCPKILVVDDEQACIDFVRESLADEPYEVVSAMDGDAGLKAAVDEEPNLIILDVQMPRKNGFEVFADIRRQEKLASVPVVMLTGIGEKTGMHFSGKDMGEYFGVEPEAYVEKPIEPILLKQVIGRLLKGKSASA